MPQPHLILPILYTIKKELHTNFNFLVGGEDSFLAIGAGSSGSEFESSCVFSYYKKKVNK